MRLLMIVSRHGSDPRGAGGDVQGSLYARHLVELGNDVTYVTSGSDGESQWEGVDIVRLGKPELLPLRAFNWYRSHGQAFDAVYAEAFGGARFPFCAPLYVRQPLLTAWYQVNRDVFIHQLGRVAGSAAASVEGWVARLHRKATILTPSEARRADLVAIGFDPDRVHAVPPFSIDEVNGLAPNVALREPLIVWLGKLRRYKSPHIAIQAMPAVLRQVPQARLVIAGRRDDEDYLKELRSMISKLHLDSRVEFALDISEEAKRRLLRRAATLVVTSPIEGFGIVILESAMHGTPAVVSEGVPEEVVSHDYNGLRVQFGDTSDLANSISSVLVSPTLRRRLALNAIDRSRRFTKDALRRQLNEVFNAAVDRTNLTAAGA